jgi:tetratricopeptide (TPR) repeat protein
LAIGTALVAGLGGGVWIALGQESTDALPAVCGTEAALDSQFLASLSWDQASACVEPVREQARAALDSGDYDTAVNRFLAIAGALPKSPQTMDALIDAGIAHARAGRPDDAMRQYEAAAALAREFLVFNYDILKTNIRMKSSARKSVRESLHRALLCKAELSMDIKDTAGAETAFRQFRAFEPEYYYLRSIVPLEARLRGVDATAMMDAERQASRLSDEAKRAAIAGDRTRALELADRIIADFPATGGALLARFTKARVLWGSNDHSATRKLYGELVEMLSGAGLECDLVREAVSTVAFYDLGPLGHTLTEQVARGEQVDPQEWDRLFAMCRYVMAYSWIREMRATAHVALISSLSNQGQLGEAVREAQRMKRRYGSAKQLADPAVRRLWIKARTYLGLALREQGQLDGAAEEFRGAINDYRDDADAWGMHSPLPMAYFGLRNVLRETGTPPADVADIEAIILSQAPSTYSYYADMIRAGLP